MANLSNSGNLIEEIEKKADKDEIHEYTAGTGIDITEDEISNTGVLSVNGESGDVVVNPIAMVILDYGTSTWAEFIDAYSRNAIVYCKVPYSNGIRMAFLAYVLAPSGNPSEAEFQYVRSVANKTATQPCDEVYIYKITKSTGKWTTTKRNMSWVNAAGDGISIATSGTAHSPTQTITNTAIQVSGDEPTASTGYLWYDTTNEILKVYDGTQWKSLAYTV